MSASTTGLSPNARGALWMIASAICFTGMTVLIKQLKDYPAPLQAIYTQVTALLILLPAISRNPKRIFSTKRPITFGGRALCSTLGVMLYYYAFQTIPLAEANALSFTRALWIAPLAALLLRERVGWIRWALLGIGFVGVLLVVQPNTQIGLGWPHAAALGSAALLAMAVIGVKSLTADHSTLSILSWAAVLGCILSLPIALFYWRWPSPTDLGWLIALGVLSVCAQLTYIRGMSEGEASAMAPIDYTRLLFALIVGYFLFNEIPGALTLAGAGLIIVATLVPTVRSAIRSENAKRTDITPPPPGF